MNIFFTLIFSLISAAALIIIYSMRAKRTPEKVSALFLWQGIKQISIEQPLFKRFVIDKLFYIHTAILIFLLSALLQSGIARSSGTGQRSIFIIDVSASMKAMEHGESRIDLAKKMALSLFKNNDGAEVMIVSAGKPVRQLLPFSKNSNRIIQVIKDIKAEDTEADLKDTLLMIKQYIRDSDRIYLFSDGAFKDLSSIIEETPNLFLISAGANGENAGIEAVETFRNEDGNISVMVTLKNFGQKDIKSTVDLTYENKVIDAQRIDLPAGGEKILNFYHVPAVAENITARLNHIDALLSDNSRYAVLSAPVSPSVLLVTRKNFFLTKFLDTLDNYHITVLTPEVYEKDIKANGGKNYDIGIYDKYVPEVEFSTASIHIDPEKKIPGIIFGNGQIAPQNIYALKDHPVMRYTDFSDIKIQKARSVISFDGSELLGSSGSPLIIVSDQKDKGRAILNFNINDSNFPKSVNFPVFFTNLLNWIQPDKEKMGKFNISSGEVFSISLPDKSASGITVVRYPDGSEKSMKIKNGMLIFSDTSSAGIYRILHEGREINFAVNIPSEESDIMQAEYTPAPGRTPQATKTSLLSYTTMWKIFGILAIILLISEKRIRERLI